EQPDAELGFEPPDLRREPGLSDPQTLGGAREASLLMDGDERAKVSESPVERLSPPCPATARPSRPPPPRRHPAPRQRTRTPRRGLRARPRGRRSHASRRGWAPHATAR